MKKFLLFFCALIVTQMAYAWYVVGSTSTFGSWTPTSAPVMTETESGVFVLENVTIDKGAEFKFIKEQKWGDELAYSGTIFANEEKSVTSGSHNTKWGGETVTGNIVLNTNTKKMQVVVAGAEDIEEVDYFVYFDNSKSNWAKVYVYTFNGVDMGNWPGKEITEKTPEGYYKVTISSKLDPTGCGLIFDNGDGGAGNQTADLTWVNNGIYNAEGYVSQYEAPETLVYNVTVPVGTPNCYIVGDFNGWGAFVPMVKVNETQYTITLDNVTKSTAYKYTCGESWDYVEMQADGMTDVANRTWTENDVVAAWKDDPTAIEEVGVDAGAAVYYNLQGVKVANPENGIFIKKQGNKTIKVVL